VEDLVALAQTGAAMTKRERLPNRRGSIRFSIEHNGTRYLATLSKFSDGRIAEIFLDAHKPESSLAVHANDAAILASLLLQHGVTVAVICRSISGPIATALANAEAMS
jgi:ribonucleoside-diphosphate reductase alpha chain